MVFLGSTQEELQLGTGHYLSVAKRVSEIA